MKKIYFENCLLRLASFILTGLAFVGVCTAQVSFPEQLALKSLSDSQGEVIQANSGLGAQVVTMNLEADLNNDGVNDLVLGVPTASLMIRPDEASPFLATNVGGVFVVFGGPTVNFAQLDLASLLEENGGDGTAGFVIVGEQPFTQAGGELAGIGDINGDGVDDLAIGVQNLQNGAANAGGVHLIFGRGGNDFPAEIHTVNFPLTDFHPLGSTLRGTQFNAGTGRSIAGGSDINGDGINDILIGNNFFGVQDNQLFLIFGRDQSNPWPGGISLFEVRQAELEDAIGTLIISNGSLTGLGGSVSMLGDVSGDGIGDILIGKSFESKIEENAGGAQLILGRGEPSGDVFPVVMDLAVSTSSVDTIEILSNVPGVAFGGVVSAIGDINDDGHDDFAIGSRFYSDADDDAGAVFVFYGKDSGEAFPKSLVVEDFITTSNRGFRIDGAPGELLGASIDALADFNGDGIDDFIIGAQNMQASGTSGGGGYVILGRANGFPVRASVASLVENGNGFTLFSGEVAELVGTGVSAGGDINGDAKSDLVMEAPNFSAANGDSGGGYLVYGQYADTPALSGRHSRAWFDPDNPGYGVLTEVAEREDGQRSVFATWFTYANGEQFWLASATAPIEPGQKQVLLPLVETSGTGFGNEFDTTQVAFANYGEALLTLENCNQLRWQYRKNDSKSGGELYLEPLLPSTLGLDGCLGEELVDPATSSLAGAWWNPERGGEGIVLDIEMRGDTPTLFFSWFTYADGVQKWLVGNVPIDSEQRGLIAFPVIETQGANFGFDFSSQDVESQSWGVVELNFLSCDELRLNYDGQFADSETMHIGGISLQRFTGTLPGVPCTELFSKSKTD